MPFGLKGAPATFARMMNAALGHLTPLQLVLYMDDLCIFSDTFEVHFERLERTFIALRQHGLRMNARECQFCIREVDFYGFRVSAYGLIPDVQKIDAVTRIPPPSSVRDVKVFLGATGWYRRFIPQYATLAKPLTTLLENGREFDWTSECQEAFVALKQKLSSAPVLAHPLPDRPFVLTTDASSVGLGAELAQVTQGNVVKPVAYFSRVLSKTERRYSTYDREFLAVIAAVRHFRNHLLGATFRLRTDHRPLQFVTNAKDPWGRRARWIAELQEYDFEMEFIDGRDKLVADALSRLEFGSVRVIHSIGLPTS